MTTFTIECAKDILHLEAHIRGVMQCQGSQCAFLQSNEYVSLKRSLLLRIAGVLSRDGPIRVHIPKTGLALSVAEADACVTIEAVREFQSEDDGEPKRKAAGKTKIQRFEQMMLQRNNRPR